MKKEKYYITIMLTLILIITVPLIFLRFPDIKNEFKYMDIIDNMIKNKEYLILKYNNQLYPDKPPIYFWLLGIVRTKFYHYSYPLSLLFFSVIPLGIICLLTFNLTKYFFKLYDAFLITLMLIFTPYFIGVSLILRMDLLFSLFIISSLYIFYIMYFKIIKINNTLLFLMYFFIGISCLIKGGAGLLIPITAIISLLIFDKNIIFLKKIKYLQGLLLILLILSLWFISIYFSFYGKEYLKLLLGQETLGRAFKSKAHIRPFYYYLQNLPLLVFPYSLFWIGSIISNLKNLKFFKNWNPIEKIAFTWFLGPFIFFSLMSGKLEIYMIPLFPAIIISIYIYMKKISKKIYFKYSIILSNIIFLILIFTIYILSYLKFNLINIQILILILVPLLISCICSIIKLKKINFNNIIISQIYFILGFLFSLIFILPLYNKIQSLQPIYNFIYNTSNKNIVSYKFSDSINLNSSLGINIKNYDNLNELINENSNKNIIILGRNKFKPKDFDSKNYSLILKNSLYYLMSYSHLTKEVLIE